MGAFMKALGITTGVVLTFAAGAWAQDQRMREHYIQEGRMQANWDWLFQGHMVYLGCLSDHCEREKFASELVVARAERELNDDGVRFRD